MKNFVVKKISGVQKEKEENVHNLVHGIANVLKIDLNLFDIDENPDRKLSIQNLDKPLIIVEFSSRKKRDKFIKKQGKIEYKSH
ncbi:unnamed protein product [Macrosiphum euphorbiae]|uniref:Uncharacterized protein n=1 Tax=Macrosiphum euphorbiae TaxID=13131 RepID=A0AAV0WBL2_9HEMI|nr:unnamed protein product [Macrosiphum euphorbiae]